MFFHFQIFFQSLLFLGLLEITSIESVNEFLAETFLNNYLLAAIAVIILIVFAFRTAHKISKKANMTPIPVLFFLGALGLSYFINSAWQQHVFQVISSLIYYFTHLGMYRLRVYAKDQTARGIIGAAALATIFFFNAAAYGIYLNFVVPLWILMLAFLCVATLVSFQYLWIIKEDKRKVLSYSLILGLAMTEIAWSVNFWPFGYLTTGVITLIFYYVFWDMVQSHFLDILTKRRVVTNIALAGVLCLMVLTSSRWLPVV
jgi:hypothetical protein